MKQQTIFDVMLELTLAELPAEYHNAWRASLLWDCATYSPENLSRICSPEFKQYLIETDTGKEFIAEMQEKCANGDTSFFDDVPESFKVLVQMGSAIAIIHDAGPDERAQRHMLN